jgi:hypothetical protein
MFKYLTRNQARISRSIDRSDTRTSTRRMKASLINLAETIRHVRIQHPHLTPVDFYRVYRKASASVEEPLTLA